MNDHRSENIHVNTFRKPHLIGSRACLKVNPLLVGFPQVHSETSWHGATGKRIWKSITVKFDSTSLRRRELGGRDLVPFGPSRVFPTETG